MKIVIKRMALAAFGATCLASSLSVLQPSNALADCSPASADPSCPLSPANPMNPYNPANIAQQQQQQDQQLMEQRSAEAVYFRAHAKEECAVARKSFFCTLGLNCNAPYVDCSQIGNSARR